jgi:Spy/CpxP family protein refolding chaperone
MMRTGIIVLGLMLLLSSTMTAQQIGRDPGVAAALFPPELVMQHQRRIELSREQRAAITAAIHELQANVVEYQWQMEDETQRLADLLNESRIDSATALAQIDRVLEIERMIKRAHLGMLVRIKNTLTSRQLEILQQLRADEGSVGRSNEP